MAISIVLILNVCDCFRFQNVYLGKLFYIGLTSRFPISGSVVLIS